jgi:hypothetical protein
MLFVAPAYADRHKQLGKKKCTALAKRSKQLEAKLRQGHSAKQGRAMKQQVRELQLKRFRQCR